jgi:electron transfer flavoprotein alpha subunit
MRIAVCIKQVPVVAELQFDPVTKSLRREGVRTEVSAFDVRAVLKAVELKAAVGGEVTVLTMGPPQAREALLECLALGADRAMHLCDAAFAGADTLATARALAAALKRAPFDLILCGRHSVDAETGQVGPEIAELLDLPQVTAARSLSVDPNNREITAERETDDGFETVVAPLPVLVSAAEDLAAERFTTRAEREAAAEKPIEVLTASDLGSDPSGFGAQGSPTWVLGLESLEVDRRREMIEGATPEQAVDTLIERLRQHGLLSPPSAFERTRESVVPPPIVPVTRSGARDVLVVAETSAAGLRPVAFELLGKAAEIAAAFGGSTWVLVVGRGAGREVDRLAAYGAERVFVAEGVEQETESLAALLTACIHDHRPGVVLMGSTVLGRDVAPRVAARLGLGLTGDCIDLSFDRDGLLLQHKPAFGGTVVALIASRTRPEMATVRPGMLAAGGERQAPSFEVVALDPSAAASRVRVIDRRAAALAGSGLDRARVVVGFGKGIGGVENLPVIESLAGVLGASLCTTRDVTDAGWLPKQCQVGMTGRVIAPDLYVAVALRGAFEHTVGIRRAGVVVAINKSPKAPIFKVCDYGVTGDFATIVPLLTEGLRRAKRETEAG